MIKNKKLLLHDIAIFTIMAVLAACGLIYEYLLSHYSGRVLGAIEQVIFAMIGIMIVAMGFGAFAARLIKRPFTAFVWLELGIAVLGSTSVLIIASAISFSELFPRIIAEVFAMPPDLIPKGNLFAWINQTAHLLPYFMGFILGFFIGMEIPLVARIREHLYGQHLEHNVGSIYGADYIGAGIGAAIWVLLMLSIETIHAAALTACANLLVGCLFLIIYKQNIQHWKIACLMHVFVLGLIILIWEYGVEWDKAMEDMLYQDKVVYRMNTKYQHITITERIMNPYKPKVFTFYINGRTQFSSFDEKIYHSLLVHPAMAISARHDNILVIGGGDGLAVREILYWQPKSVLLIDLDEKIIDLFSKPQFVDGQQINKRLITLNQHAFNDSRVKVLINDAFLAIDDLLNQEKTFDTIIIDLPDPSHPDLNKLYSTRFYSKLWYLLAGDGAMVVQSTSPYHAKRTFISIGKTIKHANFNHVEQYHHNVPSFGEWGWTIATKQGQAPKSRIKNLPTLAIDNNWITKGVMLAAFEFSKNYFLNQKIIKINRLGSNIIYQYHHQDWEIEQGILFE